MGNLKKTFRQILDMQRIIAFEEKVSLLFDAINLCLKKRSSENIVKEF